MAYKTVPRRLLTFDAWETLFHSKRPVHEVYQYYAERHGDMSYEAQEIQHRLPLIIKEHRDKYPLFGCRSTYAMDERLRATDHWWRSIIEGVFARRGCSRALVQDILRHFSSGSAYTLNVGAKDILERLEGHGFMLGILSNFDVRIYAILKDLDVLQHFHFVTLSVDCGQEKPSLAIFESAIASAQANLLHGENLCAKYHLGNDWGQDVLGASRAGWQALYLQEAINGAPKGKESVVGIESIPSLSHLQVLFDV